MAKNYKAYEAAEVIAKGLTKETAEEFQDIFRRFPFFAAKAMQLNEAGMDILKMLPEHITARKMNKGCKEMLGILDSDTVADDIDEVEEVEEEIEEVEEKPAKKKKAAKKVEPEEDDDDDLDDEEEEEEVKPKKSIKKKEKKPAKKSKKVEEPEDDDDDEDFDFD